MRIVKRRPSTVGAVLVSAAAAALFVLPASPTSAATFTNACKNGITPNNSQIGVVTMTANTELAGTNQPFNLSNIYQTAGVPGSIFVLGYNLGLLVEGVNVIPATVQTKIEGTNTVEGTQDTNTAATSISTTISDPNGVPGSGDESATPGSLSVSYADQTWTAGGSPGTIEFREETVDPVSAGAPPGFAGGLKIDAVIAGFIHVRFACSPGSVAGENPGVITFDHPAASFASTDIVSPNQAPTADAGPDQTVASQANVNLNGSGSFDPDGDALNYSWTQTSGPAVSLSGATTATPSFTAPVGPATLVFENAVCDPEPLCDTDTVTVDVATASAGGYVTPVFARGQYSGEQPGHVSMDTVKAFLDARNLDATVSVVTGWPAEHEHVVRNGGQVYLSWDDLSSLQRAGWTITSHGRTGLITRSESAAKTNAEVNGSLTDLLGRGFTDAWTLYSYKGSRGDALAQKLARASYAYGRENTSDLMVLNLPLAQPERAPAVTTWGGHCNDASLPCFDAPPKPYRLPSDLTSSMNAMSANQWTILQSYRFVKGTQLTGKVRFDCTGPETQHWTRRVGTASRETYCWNDYQSIVDGTSADFESPETIAGLYGRAIFTAAAARAGAWPEGLAFGGLATGLASSPKGLTFMNTGTAPLSISSVAMTGTNPADFALRDDGCTGMELPGGGSCSVGVVFTPSVPGARSAALTFAHTAAGSPLGVSLAGTGS